MQNQSLRPAGLALGLLALAGPALAQVPLIGTLSDATTGPLLAGTVYHAVTSLSVLTTLTIQPGVVVKFVGVGATFEVSGTLNVQGTASAPVIFTDIKDDSAGGDTNGDGPSVGVPGHWTYVRLYTGSTASIVDHLHVRYAGNNGWAALTFSGGSPTLRDCVVRECANTGLQLDGVSAPSVVRCHFEGNLGVAVGVPRFDQLAGFSGCTASGNVGGDYQFVPAHGLAQTAVVEADDLIGGVVVSQGFNIVGGGHLTLGPGVVVKMRDATAAEVTGMLDVNGTASAPVVLTSFDDDSFGGDTNGDGPSSGAPGDWTYLRFYAASLGSTCDHLVLRHAGLNNWGAITLSGGAPILRDCVVRDCQTTGLQLDPTSAPTVERCHFQDNGHAAVGVTRFDQLAGFSGCTASGNAGGDYQFVAGHGLNQTALVEVDDLIGGVVVAASFSIGGAGHLTLGPGVVVKLTNFSSVEVSGRLDARGEADAPVVITSLADDSYGGDTNMDGPSVGVPGSWVYLRFYTNGTHAELRNLVARYGGSNGWPTIYMQGDGHSLRNVRVDHAGADGFELQQHDGVASGLTAWRCAGIGIELGPNGPDVQRATVVECGTGFSKALTTSATVVDSIVHLSTSQAVVGFAPAEWRYSNGVPGAAGSNGNLFVDPGFTATASGDFRLVPSSQCIDAGDPQSPLDADGSRADMGAYPYDQARPRLACMQASAGPCNSWLATSNGYASVSGASQLVISLLDVPTNTAGIFFYGQSSAPVAFPPFGTVCGLPPFIRAVALSSGGDPQVGPCAGRFDFDVTAYLQTPAGLALPIGTAITGQYWYRDNVSSTVRYSDALRIPIRP